MKTRLQTFSILVTSLALTAIATCAETAPPQPTRELAIVVVDAVNKQQGAITDFDRIDMAFTRLAKERDWPVTIKAERFAANTPAHETELRIFNRPVRQETPGDLVFRGWVTLTVDGTKHDFGMIMYRYYLRAGEHMDDVLDKVFLGAAKVAADKIEPILFPSIAGKKS